ncbi:hypothetical protein [Weissella paramesenteroides]|uniref:hypothetical protein n=1 Tax=Weissella paramesenteroides TaxID=1249 RepID=UPI003F74553B
MEQENQDLDDLAAYESGFSIDERLAGREIAKILREKNFSYKQKSKVLHFVDKALYTVLVNDNTSRNNFLDEPSKEQKELMRIARDKTLSFNSRVEAIKKLDV